MLPNRATISTEIGELTCLFIATLLLKKAQKPLSLQRLGLFACWQRHHCALPWRQSPPILHLLALKRLEEATFLSDCRSDSAILANRSGNMCPPKGNRPKISTILLEKIFTKLAAESSSHQFFQRLQKIGTHRYHFPAITPTQSSDDTTCRTIETSFQLIGTLDTPTGNSYSKPK